MEELEKKVSLTHEKHDGYGEIFEEINNNQIDSILITKGYYDMLLESGDESAKNTRVLYQFSIKEQIKDTSIDVDVTNETFSVYISGIDSYGSVTDQSRSDVNIIMTVNPKAKKILLINTPRDYYVGLYGQVGNIKLNGEKDKLTHAGTYGVSVSQETLENLFDIKINYYFKVNYNAVIKLVDALDGVDVYSDHNFSTYDYHYRINKGMNHVNGKQALDFVRTRKAFTDGDRVRGENQQHLIEAIFKKVSTAEAVLMKFDQILSSLEGNFTTNLSTKKITSLVKMQLDDMATWDIKSIAVNGSDGSEFTHSYQSQKLYVMIPDEETINAAKAELKAMQK